MTLAARQDDYLFEQNAFNVTAWREPTKVRLLDLWRWNVHGQMLARIGRSGAGELTCYDHPVIGLHATSADAAHVKREGCSWSSGNKRSQANLRFFTHPALREIQRGLFERFITENPDVSEAF